jgi:site-specific DNA-methyltransferase (adenine-specific)
MSNRITEQPFCQTSVSGSTFVNADCFDVFPFIEDKSIDAIICDLPYGTTACKWDTIIPFEPLWEQYKRVIKPNGAIVLFSKEPFTCILRTSEIKIFKQPLIWDKVNSDNPMQAKRRHLNTTEDISIFYKSQCTYNPQGLIKSNIKKGGKQGIMIDSSGKEKEQYIQENTNYPKNILVYPIERKAVHPTQKPEALLQYLVKTYTNEGDIVLDNCMGSGTTNLACLKLNRKSIGIEKEKQYYDVAVRRASEYCH